jgi:flavin reductase (DIM6/NTAB) family NADH-FMN oxidoreductase RutF
MGLVTEDILPLSDYFGCKSGYDADKMDIPAEIGKGQVLDVPVLEACHWTYELEVANTFRDGNVDIYLCKIRNVLADEALSDASIPDEEKLRALRPVNYVVDDYYSWEGKFLGKMGEPGKVYMK